jgi:hypothetical protein
MGDARAVVSGIMCLFFAGIVAVALGWSRDTGLAPLVVGIPGLVLSFLQLTEDMRVSRQTPDRFPRPALVLVGWIAGFVFLTLAIGLLAGASVSIAAFLRLHERASLGMAIAIAVIYTGIAWLLFDSILEQSLFQGMLFT